jgi:hypothetical protein
VIATAAVRRCSRGHWAHQPTRCTCSGATSQNLPSPVHSARSCGWCCVLPKPSRTAAVLTEIYIRHTCLFCEQIEGTPSRQVNHRREFGERGLRGAIEEMQRRAWLCAGAVEAELESGRRCYILGDTFSAADIMLGYSLLLLERLGGVKLSEWSSAVPHVAAYYARLRARPGFVTALSVPGIDDTLASGPKL